MQQLRLTVDRCIAELLIGLPEFRLVGLEEATQELILEKRFGPIYAGDTASWHDICKWFLSEVWGLSNADVQATAGQAPSGTYAYRLRPNSPKHGALVPKSLLPSGIAVISEQELDSEGLWEVLRAVGYEQEHLIALFLPEAPDEGFFGRDCFVINRDQIVEMIRLAYIDAYVADRTDPSEGLVLRAIAGQKYAVPLETRPRAIMVDIREEHFRKLLATCLRTETAFGIHFIGSLLGGALRPGDSVVFYVWDSLEFPEGAIAGIAKLTEQPTLMSSADSPTVEHVRQSGFSEMEAALGYLNGKPHWRVLEFEDLTVAEGTTWTYEQVASSLLGINPNDQRALDSAFRHWPSEDVGYTYLSQEQLERVRAEIEFSVPTGDSRWAVRGQAASAIKESLRGKPWINQKVGVWQTYQHWLGLREPMRQSIERFLSQLNTVEEASLVEELLGHIDYWDHTQMAEEFKALLDVLREGGDGREIVPVPFGGLGDSSAHISYVIQQPGIYSRSIHDVLGDDNLSPKASTLLLYDDNIATGWQAELIIHQLLGIDDPRTEREFHAEALSPQQTSRLKRFEILFAFLCGNMESAKGLVSKARKLGLNVKDPIVCHEQQPGILFSDQSPLFSKSAKREDLIERLRLVAQGVGLQLLLEKMDTENWSKEKCQDYSLGYGGHQQLTIFSHNTPSSAVTFLWKAGKLFDGQDWSPLFPRRSGAKPPTVEQFVRSRLSAASNQFRLEVIKICQERGLAVRDLVAPIAQLRENLAEQQGRAARTRGGIKTTVAKAFDSLPMGRQ